ncbi:TetR/AcrR family transcriptional regulator [Tardiphaga sp. P9-11]|uniref:TetR/AcrR family transcriptional regulator n=1 Tax=Tardiphaga sp. P9-11 TaxID=2024614 RepID=UPI0032E36740
MHVDACGGRMARPREFDETKVLDAAIQCFWSRGYEATSVRDLAHSMGMTGASLYNAFGDKRALYRKSLDRYVAQNFGTRVERIEHHLQPRQAITAFFDEIIARSLDDSRRKGCMLINSAVEMAPHDKRLGRVIADVLLEMERFFLRCVKAGQRDGTITKSQSADNLAKLLLGTLLGIRVLARARPEPDLLRGILKPVAALLDQP